MSPSKSWFQSLFLLTIWTNRNPYFLSFKSVTVQLRPSFPTLLLRAICVQIQTMNQVTKQDSLLVVYQSTSPEMGEIYWPGRIDKRNQEVVDLPLLCWVHILSTFFGWSQIFSGYLVMFWMNYGSNCSHNPFLLVLFLAEQHWHRVKCWSRDQWRD